MSGNLMREKILNASKMVFAQNGLRETSVEDILKEAKVARATFYKYFSSKRHVFIELLKDFLSSLYDNTVTAISFEGDSPESIQSFSNRLEKGLALFYKYFIENLPIVRVYYSEAFGSDPSVYAIWDEFDRRMVRELSRIIKKGSSSGIFRKVNADLAAQTLVMVFLEVPYRYMIVHRRTGIDVRELAREMVSLVMAGLKAEKIGLPHEVEKVSFDSD